MAVKPTAQLVKFAGRGAQPLKKENLNRINHMIYNLEKMEDPSQLIQCIK